MHKDELTTGALKYKLGHSYKDCATTEELNDYTKEERLSKCGYLERHWNVMGKTAGRQLRIRQPDNNTEPMIFVGERISKEQVGEASE